MKSTVFRLSALLAFCCAWGFAQTTNDALTAAKGALTNSTAAVAVTASQGDGATCTVTKLAGGQINFSYLCSSSDGKTTLRSGAVQSNSAAASSQGILFGDILCLLVVNPAAAPITMGSVGPAPAKGIAWSCTTAITGGGSTVATTGSVSWP